MTAILTLTVLVLIAISLWQVAKIFEMSQATKDNSQVANDHDNDIQGKLMFAFLAFLYILTYILFGNGEMYYYQKLHQNMEAITTV